MKSLCVALYSPPYGYWMVAVVLLFVIAIRVMHARRSDGRCRRRKGSGPRAAVVARVAIHRCEPPIPRDIVDKK